MAIKEVPKWWKKLRYFRADEKFKHHTGLYRSSFPQPEEMDEGMMKRLDRARKYAGITFTVTSSYRPGDPRSHGKGLAVDIRVAGSAFRKKIVKALDKAGFLRIGIYDKHIHADTDPNLPPGWWGGKSE